MSITEIWKLKLTSDIPAFSTMMIYIDGLGKQKLIQIENTLG